MYSVFPLFREEPKLNQNNQNEKRSIDVWSLAGIYMVNKDAFVKSFEFSHEND